LKEYESVRRLEFRVLTLLKTFTTHEDRVNTMIRKRVLPRGWYPVDGKDCQKEIESFLEGWTPDRLPSSKGVGGIVPHAGWYFSGRLAARVFSTLKLNGRVDAVVIYGGHLTTQDLPRIVTEEAWETPFGEIEIHTGFAESLMKSVEMRKESPTSADNTIEVHLAMVKYFFPEATLVAVRSPLSVKAEILGREVARIATRDKLSILAIGSTDLTHYGPNYGFTGKGVGPASVEWVKKENDRGFIDRAVGMDAEGLLKHAMENDSACSAGAALSALATCKALGAKKGTLLDYYTSYDIMPDDSFVGYAGILY
jgi:AmmeMemoRadiSam system protein B